MVTKTATSLALAQPAREEPALSLQNFIPAVRNGLLAALIMAVVAAFLEEVLAPIIATSNVEETVTTTLSRTFLLLLPFVAYIAGSSAVRHLRERADYGPAVIIALVTVLIVYTVIALGQFAFELGAFREKPTLGFVVSDVENGVLVEAIEPGSPADLAELRVGDVITAIRRDPVDGAALHRRIARSEADAPLRLRFMRGDEELQVTARVALERSADFSAVWIGLGIAIFVSVVAIFWPGKWTPYVLLFAFLSPLLVGYLWLIIATFSFRTEGLLPLTGDDSIGGLTLNNWRFLFGENISGLEFSIWQVALNSLVIALLMTIVVLLVSSMAGYALSRMTFKGRRAFLSFTLILHGFPAVTLLIPIFFVLINIGHVPLLGSVIGFNKLGGIALVMVAFELPLGVWLMKGFFDGVSWDMERSALIDGATRWRTYWEIILPQIRPGLLALGIFAFISGWNAFIIPQTYSIGAGTVNLPVFLNELIDETAPVAWNQVAAVGLFQLIPILVFFVFAQEYLLNIYAGGTKGTS